MGPTNTVNFFYEPNEEPLSLDPLEPPPPPEPDGTLILPPATLPTTLPPEPLPPAPIDPPPTPEPLQQEVETLQPAVTETPQPSPEPIPLPTPPVPLAPAPAGNGTWALFNLIFSAAGIALALLMGIRLLLIKRREKDDKAANLKSRNSNRLALIIATPCMAVVGIALFFIIRDTSLSMAMFDWWSIAHGILLIGGILGCTFAIGKGNAPPPIPPMPPPTMPPTPPTEQTTA